MDVSIPSHISIPSRIIQDIKDTPPPLMRDGQPILTMPVPGSPCCYECNNSDVYLFTKQVLWNITEGMVVYVDLKVCEKCWDSIGWEAWTTVDITSDDMDPYLESLWYNSH
jgi:hypothetical protein